MTDCESKRESGASKETTFESLSDCLIFNQDGSTIK